MQHPDQIINCGPVAIGGLGGSGTRVIAQILSDLGFFLGADMNPQYDNLWFAFLFGRRDILLADEGEFTRLANLFFRQMSAPQKLNDNELMLLQDRLVPKRIQHDLGFLQKRHDSFIDHGCGGEAQVNWGWKVPYTYVFADRLLTLRPELKYIHLTRDALDMAFSRNRNQLLNWGPIYLNRNVENTPAEALSFWCAVHRRTARLSQRFPDRVFNIDFGQLIDSPKRVLADLFAFIGIDPEPGMIDHCSSIVKIPATVGRYKNYDISALLPQDIEYLSTVG